MRILLFIVCIFLTGCSSLGTVYRYDKGVKTKLYELELNKEGAMTFKDKDIEIMIETRKPTAWERFIQPVLSGAKQNIQGSVNAE